MIEEAKKFEDEDERLKMVIEKKLDLENYIVTMGRLIAEYGRVLPEEMIVKANEGIGELEDTMKSGDGKKMDEVFEKTRKITDEIEKIARKPL
jgi:molecular chaperone DnaK (HSP70)